MANAQSIPASKVYTIYFKKFIFLPYSANQYENAFAANRLQNYEIPSKYKPHPTPRVGRTNIVANDRGHLLPGVPRSAQSPWGNFKGTWDTGTQSIFDFIDFLRFVPKISLYFPDFVYFSLFFHIFLLYSSRFSLFFKIFLFSRFSFFS